MFGKSDLIAQAWDAWKQLIWNEMFLNTIGCNCWNDCEYNVTEWQHKKINLNFGIWDWQNMFLKQIA